LSGNRQVLVSSRLKQARECLEEADVLRQSGMSGRSVVNRLYYAMFYAVLALLQHKGLGTSKHSGAIACFDGEFVRAGHFSKELSKALHRAFELRQKADYMEEVEVTVEDITELRPVAEQFVAAAEKFLLEMKSIDKL
jgi:uncharacterized protein (UPF0332 family)